MAKLKLNGEGLVLRYDMNALCEIEEHLGIALSDLGEHPATIKTLRTLLWAGLLHDKPGLTEVEVGSWIDGSNFAEAMEAVTEALAEAFGGSGANPTKLGGLAPPAVGTGKPHVKSHSVQ